jgi:hypothetical protein
MKKLQLDGPYENMTMFPMVQNLWKPGFLNKFMEKRSNVRLAENVQMQGFRNPEERGICQGLQAQGSGHKGENAIKKSLCHAPWAMRPNYTPQ